MAPQDGISQSAILADREARWQYRCQLVARFGVPVGTLTLNIPGPDKNLPGTTSVLVTVYERLRQRLQAAALPILHVEHREGADGLAIHLVVDGPALDIKRCAVEVEEQDRLGRLADIDVLDAQAIPVGREQLGRQPRRCLVCDRAAVLCMREQRHDPAILADAIRELLCQ